MWERLWQQLEVAVYVRMLGRFEQDDSRAAFGQLAARSADALGLTITGMRANRWRVVEANPPRPAQAEKRGPSIRDRFDVRDSDRLPARDRFEVVPPVAVADDLDDGA